MCAFVGDPVSIQTTKLDPGLKPAGMTAVLTRAEGSDLFDLVGLSQFLEDKLQRKVDVVPRDALRDELKDDAFAEAVAV